MITLKHFYQIHVVHYNLANDKYFFLTLFIKLHSNDNPIIFKSNFQWHIQRRMIKLKFIVISFKKIQRYEN